jgi:hypothetical protein
MSDRVFFDHAIPAIGHCGRGFGIVTDDGAQDAVVEARRRADADGRLQAGDRERRMAAASIDQLERVFGVPFAPERRSALIDQVAELMRPTREEALDQSILAHGRHVARNDERGKRR